MDTTGKTESGSSMTVRQPRGERVLIQFCLGIVQCGNKYGARPKPADVFPSGLPTHSYRDASAGRAGAAAAAEA